MNPAAASETVADWRWGLLPALIIGALVLGRILAHITRLVLIRATKKSKTKWDDELVGAVSGPIGGGWTVVLLYIGEQIAGAWDAVALPPDALGYLDDIIRVVTVMVVFWALLGVVELAIAIAASRPWAIARPASRSLLSILGRGVKVAILFAGVITMLSELGIPVASLVAGLGIGGLAIALAGQKTVEHLFGTVSIGFDQPFAEGDFVSIDGTVGTIETIGLRSTRIRTLDRTLVTIPNGLLAEMRSEVFSVRDRIRLYTTIGLTYDTTQDQMRAVLKGFEQVLRDHPAIWPDAMTVRFKAFGPSSLDIDVMAWFMTSDWAKFQEIRQGVLLQFMGVVEREGCGFAFPTQTVHVVRDEPPARPA
jgi:MscS family membrane protein